MIVIKNLNQSQPFQNFEDLYKLAIKNNQQNIEILAISSYSTKKAEVDSRYVNLKYLIDESFIFFTNYNSIKAQHFREHKQASALIYWPSINYQIRMKGFVKKTKKNFNIEYFKKRSPKKNALSISSAQSQEILSYNQVLEDYDTVKKSKDLTKCPEYWGGYEFIPYYFEFWQGNESRINKREVYSKIDSVWKHSYLQP